MTNLTVQGQVTYVAKRLKINKHFLNHQASIVSLYAKNIPS